MNETGTTTAPTARAALSVSNTLLLVTLGFQPNSRGVAR
jgi:hypothetical protein